MTDGIKVMSRGFSGGKQVKKAVYVRNRGRLFKFYTTESEELFTLKKIMAGEVVCGSDHCFFSGCSNDRRCALRKQY